MSDSKTGKKMRYLKTGKTLQFVLPIMKPKVGYKVKLSDTYKSSPSHGVMKRNKNGVLYFSTKIGHFFNMDKNIPNLFQYVLLDKDLKKLKEKSKKTVSKKSKKKAVSKKSKKRTVSKEPKRRATKKSSVSKKKKK